MRMKLPLKDNNRGASLAAVLIAIVVVATIGTLITQITITNISMKEIQKTGQTNFYSAEEIMDELTAGLNDSAATAMQKAYITILTQYKDTMVAGDDIQAKFTRLYMDELKNIFWNYDDPTFKYTSTTTNPYNVSEVIFVLGYYKPSILQSTLPSAYSSAVETALNEAFFTADFTAGEFTLENVKIHYDNGRGYDTEITTSIVFSTPKINFTGSNSVSEFMRYSLIADNAIEVARLNTKVGGNVYAGAGGIYTKNSGTANFNGSKIVTRGDIKSYTGTELSVGNGSTTIWAENIGTDKVGSNADPSKLTMNGTMFIADDLLLNGKNSSVSLSGSYFGYNYQEKYDAVRQNVDAKFSSAMMINGQGSKLDLTGINYLLLAGQTYISRGEDASNSDILLGESVSARTNQLAYYVPVAYLDITTKPDGSQVIKFNDGNGNPGISSYESKLRVSNLASYLNSTKPVVAYHFQDNSEATTRYYLNFKNEQKANDFFAAYYAANSSVIDNNAKIYADAIKINDTWMYTLKGDLMYTDGAGKVNVSKVNINSENWKVDEAYGALAKRIATMYMSNQVSLEDTHIGVDSNNIRFYDSFGKIDKTINSLVESLVDVDQIDIDLPQSGNTSTIRYEDKAVNLGGTQYEIRAVINNKAAGSEAYRLDSKYVKGIVVATGDVIVEGNFEGLIISGGTISFGNNGSYIQSNEQYISTLFLEDINRLYIDGVNPIFSIYFKDYKRYADSVIGIVQVDEYTRYADWVKNEDKKIK